MSIHSKQDLKYFLQQDKIALHYTPKYPKRPHLFKDEIWKYEILLRKNEYCTNCLTRIWLKPYKYLIKYRFHKMSVKLGFTVPINRIGPGFSIAHFGLLTIGNARIGRNCRIQEGVNIGATGGNSKAARIGNNVFIGTGAKIIGNIKIADGVTIGAGSVVVKDIFSSNVTVAGVPAKIISKNNSSAFLDKRLDGLNLADCKK